MNNLSWMLYFSEVLPNLASVLGFLGGGAILAWLMVSLFYMMGHETYHGKTWPLIASLAWVLVATLMPSQKTILLIAGSEAGEYVATTESGKAIISDVQEAIRAQLHKLAKETTE